MRNILNLLIVFVGLFNNFFRIKIMRSKFFILCLLFLVGISCNQKTSEQKPRLVCLNMIVKNESKVIERCLASARTLIDYWVIVDTGSSDGTQEIIKKYLKDIPGELHERPWVNFSHNRNEALQLAKGKSDYILLLDADEELKVEQNFIWPLLDQDFYYIRSVVNGTDYRRKQLIKNALNWKWEGVLHEFVHCPEAKTFSTLDRIWKDDHADGARSHDPKKYKKDVKILEEALLTDPNNSRYVFYLAQSYKCALDYPKSLQYYQKRSEMGGDWEEEVFWSMYQVAFLKQALNESASEIINSYLKAFAYRPRRIEPLYSLARYFRAQKNYTLGYQFAKIASKISMPDDLLFNLKWMYEYGALLELSNCANMLGKYEESAETLYRILQVKDLPQIIKEFVVQNLGCVNAKLVEKIAQESDFNSNN